MAFEENAKFLGLNQGPPCTGQITCWEVMRKSTLPEINLVPRYLAKRFGKLSNVASLLRNVNSSGPADVRILYDENILTGGEVMRNLLYKSFIGRTEDFLPDLIFL